MANDIIRALRLKYQASFTIGVNSDNETFALMVGSKVILGEGPTIEDALMDVENKAEPQPSA